MRGKEFKSETSKGKAGLLREDTLHRQSVGISEGQRQLGNMGGYFLAAGLFHRLTTGRKGVDFQALGPHPLLAFFGPPELSWRLWAWLRC